LIVLGRRVTRRDLVGIGLTFKLSRLLIHWR